MNDCVMLGHGSGGAMMKRIIEEVFFDAYGSAELLAGDDAAVLSLVPPFDVAPMGSGQRGGEHECSGQTSSGHGSNSNSQGGSSQRSRKSTRNTQIATQQPPNAAEQTPNRLAFSTDSFVVSPHFFPGGDIGRLAVCGTVNDVATSGAVPLYLSCGFILEEGFALDDLKRICASMAAAAQEAGVRIVTGDTKVVNRGLADGVFINTAGVGLVPAGLHLSGVNCQPGDKVLVSGTLGDHGITIMSCRESLSFTTNIESDAAPLNHLICDVLEATDSLASPAATQLPAATDSLASPAAAAEAAAPAARKPREASAPLETTAANIVPVRCFRDPTRGGLASTLNELAAQSGVDIMVEEEAIPVKDAVRGACDMLGYDVLQVANEGKMVCVVAPEAANAALTAMRANPYGRDAAIIGEVAETAACDPKVYVRNAFGGRRILDMLVGEQLPRIC